MEDKKMRIFEKVESQVRVYSRMFPTVFSKAKGSLLYDEAGKEYIDFFSGAGVINYGHNNPDINERIVEYIQQNGVIHSLDMFTTAKREFLENFYSFILKQRGLDYKIQFCGPTGTNAIEAALKLAKKVKKRRGIIAFTNAFHGLSAGALSVTGNSHYKDEFFMNDMPVTFMPYDGYLGPDIDTTQILRKFLTDKGSGVRPPAAIILEIIQAEGGVNVATIRWLQEIEKICKEFNIILIVDDIQVGCGRSGDFFSFERAEIKPDVVVLSKAIGAGLPLSIILINPKFDIWEPGEHTGTFRGNNLSFIAGAQAIKHYWETSELSNSIKKKSKFFRGVLEETKLKYLHLITEIRGYGLIYGIVIPKEGFCVKVAKEAFKQGLIIELAGPNNEVLKILPPLTIDVEIFRKGVNITERSIDAVLKDKSNKNKS